MKKIMIFFSVVAATMCLTSCEDYFDDVPENATTIDDVFSNRGLTLSWLTNVYSFTPDNTNLRFLPMDAGDLLVLRATNPGLM